MRKTMSILAALFVSVPAVSEAASYHHVNALAADVLRMSTELFREFQIHYRHTPEYRHLISDTREMRELALHIREVARQNGAPSHLSRDLRELDRAFHHLEDVVDRIERSGRCYYRRGHFQGDPHVEQLMRMLEDRIHHLKADIDSLVRDDCDLYPNARLSRPAFPHNVPVPYDVPAPAVRYRVSPRGAPPLPPFARFMMRIGG